MNLRSIFPIALAGICAAQHENLHHNNVKAEDDVSLSRRQEENDASSMPMATALKPVDTAATSTSMAVAVVHPIGGEHEDYSKSKSKSGKSKSAKGSNNINVVDIDKFVAFAFATFGFLGLANKINEEKSIDILTRIVRKADELENTIIGEEGGGGMRRLQSFGTNDNLFLAYIQVSVLKSQGLDDGAILDQLSLVFTERVVGSITGILVEPTPQPSEGPSASSRPSESLSPSLGPSSNPSESQSLTPSNPSESAKIGIDMLVKTV